MTAREWMESVIRRGVHHQPGSSSRTRRGSRWNPLQEHSLH